MKRFVLILVTILVLASGGLVGWRAWHNKNSGSNTSANTYAGWKTYTLANVGLSVKYPSDWTTPSGGIGESSIEINSPVNNGYYFTLLLESGGESTDLNFLGNGPGKTVLTLSVPGSTTQLYLVAQIGGNDVTGLGLCNNTR